MNKNFFFTFYISVPNFKALGQIIFFLFFKINFSQKLQLYLLAEKASSGMWEMCPKIFFGATSTRTLLMEGPKGEG